jgi:hypothetical protein
MHILMEKMPTPCGIVDHRRDEIARIPISEFSLEDILDWERLDDIASNRNWRKKLPDLLFESCSEEFLEKVTEIWMSTIIANTVSLHEFDDFFEYSTIGLKA